jgi:hypothetical protein
MRAHRPSDGHEAYVMSSVRTNRERERHLDVSEWTVLIAASFLGAVSKVSLCFLMCGFCITLTQKIRRIVCKDGPVT